MGLSLLLAMGIALKNEHFVLLQILKYKINLENSEHKPEEFLKF